MTKDSDTICIYPAENLVEANLVKGLLTGEGIDVELKGDHLTGAMGELPPTELTVGVLISSDKKAQGQAIIDHYISCRKSADDRASDWTCADCGEINHAQFEICWQCQRDPNEQ
jgi:hypothetical protein